MKASRSAFSKYAGLGLALVCGSPSLPVFALDLVLPPSAALNREVDRNADSFFVATGPYRNGRVPSLEVEGAELVQTWQFSAPGLTSLQIMSPLRDQVVQAGYEILLDCAAQECGGFDFRYQIDVLPAPDMYVDLFEYRFLSARSKDGGSETRYLELLASRVGTLGYVQVSQVTQMGVSAPSLVVSGAATDDADRTTQNLSGALRAEGRFVLKDLDFVSGSVDLGPGPYASLTTLAEFLGADDTRRVALVGHTDAVGGLQANLTLSRRRAEAVRDRLISEYGVPARQLEADGAAYLAPLMSNLTPAGRETNRRVEVVLLNTE